MKNKNYEINIRKNTIHLIFIFVTTFSKIFSFIVIGVMKESLFFFMFYKIVNSSIYKGIFAIISKRLNKRIIYFRT